MRIVLGLALALVGCGRIDFDPRSDASPPDSSTLGIDATPLQCTRTGLECQTDVVVMQCGSACFAFCDEPLSFSESESRCAAWSGGLATLATEPDYTCLEGLTGGVGTWIGLVQQDDALQTDTGWQWTDGTAVTLDHWGAAEPNDNDGTEKGAEQCAVQKPSGWLDTACADSFAFACKRPAP